MWPDQTTKLPLCLLFTVHFLLLSYWRFYSVQSGRLLFPDEALDEGLTQSLMSFPQSFPSLISLFHWPTSYMTSCSLVLYISLNLLPFTLYLIFFLANLLHGSHIFSLYTFRFSDLIYSNSLNCSSIQLIPKSLSSALFLIVIDQYFPLLARYLKTSRPPY